MEALEKAGGTKKKKKATKATKKKATKKAATPRKRAKTKSAARKQLLWGIFNGNMKEEGRFAYHDRAAAEEKLEALKVKSPKKMFFIQPVKEEVTATKADDEEDE